MLTRVCSTCGRKNTTVRMLNPNEQHYVNMKCKYHWKVLGSLGVPTETNPFGNRVPGSGAVPPFNGLIDKTGLVSYWKLDEASGNRLDSFGTNHLTSINNPVNAPGKIGNGCNFNNASGQSLSHPDTSPLGNEDFTYTVWFKRALGADNQIFLIAKDAAGGRSYVITTVEWGLQTIAVVTIPNSNSLDIGTWHFIVAWHNSVADTINVQMDNGAVASVTTNGQSPIVSATPVAFGARKYVGFEGYFDGVIDEVSLWRRVLTPAERTALYNNGNGLPY